MSEAPERRLAAIVAADVAGYSRLIGADEEATLFALRAHRDEFIEPMIAEHGGRVANTAGDSLLLEFPSVVNAVRCCLAVQEGIAKRNVEVPDNRRILFRIGINVGDVVSVGDDLLGDGVNIAARLEAQAEPGGICLSGDAYRQAKGKIAAEFEDLGELELKNITEPVRAYRITSDQDAAASSEATSAALPLPDKPSIAVLPFENMSGDPEQEVFADGITEEIITTLSKVPSLLVIARNSTFAYRGTSVDVRQVGIEQGVRYVLEGSIRKSGNRVRISAQLIDATTSHHVWAERYDRSIDDIFQLQDEIALKVATEIQVELTEGEMARFRGTGTENLEAWVEQVRAVAKTRVISKESFALARQYAERSIRLDPNYPAPLCILGFINTTEGRLGFSESRDTSIAEARKCANQALALDPHNPEALGVLGFADAIEGLHEDSIARFKTALDVNPNHADVAIRLSATLSFNEKADEAVKVAEKAMRLNPKYPGFYAGVYGFALRLAGRYDEAIHAFREYGKLAEGFGHVDLTIIFVMTDKLDAARREATEVLKHKPDFTISKWAETQLHTNTECLRMDVEALRQAGLPD
ncbi:MAG: adenylate/guanylate cyclase domain-containing protein [Boseongicola sp.]